MQTRAQYSLFLPSAAAAPLEALRRRLDPVQHDLIPAHVTLLRDEEALLVDPALLAARLADRPLPPLTLRFGRAQGFDGHGLLLPCLAGEPDFHQLRSALLGAEPQRRQAPHITLAHPRNPKAPDNDIALTRDLAPEFAVHFEAFQHIEQTPGTPWQVRHSFALSSRLRAG